MPLGLSACRRLAKHQIAARFVVTELGLTAITALHALEGAVWAASYLLAGALPNFRTAMLYSIEAITSYGHESTALEQHWQMMGALEALNGMILFELTTAFLFAMIQSSASCGAIDASAGVGDRRPTGGRSFRAGP